MRRSPRSLVAWFAALLVAVLTVAVVFSDLATLHRRARDLGAPRRVVVAAHDLALGATLGASDVREISRYASEIPENAVVDVDVVVGFVVAVPVLAGTVLLEPNLTERDRDGLGGLVAVGYRAVRVRPEDGLQPPAGAVVDVLVALDPTLSEGHAAQVVAHAARVLAVEADDDALADGAGVTLLVTEDEARGVAFAAANGVLTLALAPPEDVLSIARFLMVLATTTTEAATHELNAAKAVVLGIVEGVTEYLPISSTGHLLVTQKLLGVGDTDATKDAADTYAITIQAGAILAVVVLYYSRLKSMASGLVGRDENGRSLLLALAIAFVPAALVGVALESAIKDHLFGVGPVIAAWIVGGVAILFAARYFRQRTPGTTPLESMTVRAAVIIGVAQILALWPGTSRSLVTILAALALGFSMSAALEFSFLLGLATLTAATAFEALKNGGDLIDTFGWVNPLIGFVVAFVSAVIAVRWLVGYLNKHGLELFGWYRLGVAALALVLVATGAL